MLSQIVVVPGIKNMVEVVDLEYLNSLPISCSKLAKDKCLAAGGFYSMCLTPAHIAAAIAAMPEMAVECAASVPGDRIIVLNDVLELMSKDSIMAILHHEDAHLQLGHLNNIAAVLPVEGPAIIDCLQMELEADAHAAGIVGNTAMSTAIIDVVRALAVVTASVKSEISADSYAEFLIASQAIQARLAALVVL